MPLATSVLRVAALCCPVLLGACQSIDVDTTARQGRVVRTAPANPEPGARYAIYLHGNGLDRVPEAPALQRFDRVTEALAAQGLVVIAEIRGQDTIRKSPEDLDLYARKVARQVNDLLAAGVPARHVTVVGYSRGGLIAQMTAGYVGRADVGYAILAACVSERGSVKSFVPVQMRYAEKLAGRFLSVIEESDADFGSCAPYFARAGNAAVAAESSVSTGKGHLLFSEPDERWLTPLAAWLRREGRL